MDTSCCSLSLESYRLAGSHCSAIVHCQLVATLVGYSSASAVQACCHIPSLFSPPSSMVPRRLYCVPDSEVPGRQHLRSARCHQLSFHQFAASLSGHLLFLSSDQQAGITAWSAARSSCWLWTILAGLEDVYVRRTFETLACFTGVIALYKSTFTYLLTYLLPASMWAATSS